LTWPYHCSLFFSMVSMMSGFPFTPTISFICSFLCVRIKGENVHRRLWHRRERANWKAQREMIRWSGQKYNREDEMQELDKVGRG
jgi:hypothetical protein